MPKTGESNGTRARRMFRKSVLNINALGEIIHDDKLKEARVLRGDTDVRKVLEQHADERRKSHGKRTTKRRIYVPKSKGPSTRSTPLKTKLAFEKSLLSRNYWEEQARLQDDKRRKK